MNQIAALRPFDACDLMPGTRLLNGQYQILEPLQQGGFAMTYVARDSLDRNVVIKECFPAGLCERRGGQVRAISPAHEAQFAALKSQFISEARGVAKLKHPYVVAVHQVFEENNTAYMALDYVDGIDLISMQEDQPQRLTPAFLETTLREALKAVRFIHSKGILHRDIAPDNLRVDASDRITLIDFGAAGARNASFAFAATALPAVKDGYSPPEFYQPGAVHDFSSDLYSLGATFYLLITGQVPPSGEERAAALAAGHPDPYLPLSAGAWGCGYPLVLTIDMALQLDRRYRPQSADAWLMALDEAPRERPAPMARPVRADRADLARGRSDPQPEVDLVAVLSRLVKDVNRNLTPEARGVSQPPAPTAVEARDEALTKRDHWVDMFGNPITDVETWLIEQDTRVAPDPDPVEEPALFDPILEILELDAPEPEPAPPEPPVRRSVLRSLISRCLNRRPETCPT